MNKIQFRYKNILAIISAIALLLAIPAIWPYAYYQLLRWLIAGSAIFIAYLAYNLNKQGWIWLMVAIAILFNPISPIHLDKETWMIIDVVVAIIFIISLKIGTGFYKTNNKLK